ncbi:hypothetical protein V2J09_017139, partial [Rumex salicifolius]
NDSAALKSFSLASKYLYSVESRHRQTLCPLRADLLIRLLLRRRYPFVLNLDLSLCPRVEDYSLRRMVMFLANIRSINLSDSRFVTAAGISSLVSKYHALTEIDLSNSTELTDSASAEIAEAAKLERLSLARCVNATDLGVGLIALKCKELRSLDLSFVPITEKCLPQILELEYPGNLVLTGCFATGKCDFSTLEHGCKSVRVLDLSVCKSINHIGISNLTNGATCLTSLSLAYGSAVTVDVARSFQNFDNIQCVKLDGSLVTFSSLEAIRDKPEQVCTGVTDEGICSLVNKHTELRKLDLTYCQDITSISINCVTDSCRSLTSLKMESCDIVMSDTFCFIGHRCYFLEELDVTFTDVNDAGLKAISNCSRLTSLKLGELFLGITDEGLNHVGMKCSSLTEVDLYSAIGITDKGIGSIASGCPLLESVNIDYCVELGDKSLISLSKFSRLKTLTMRGCVLITSKGLAAIAAACRQLSVLDLETCFNIDDSGMFFLPVSPQTLNRLQNLITVNLLHVLTPTGLRDALSVRGGMKIVKLNSKFKSLLPKALIDLKLSRGCEFEWRDF